MTQSTMSAAVWPGRSHPLGATWDGQGTNFAIFSENATAIELCLFDSEGNERRLALPEVTNHVWHGYLPGIGPGQHYGYRVYGDYSPKTGQRFNAHKLLLDPYALAVSGDMQFSPAIFGFPMDRFADSDRDLIKSDVDDAAYVPKGIVVDGSFDWSGDHYPETPWHETIIYEVHVKGFTQKHPDIPVELQGTYADGIVREGAGIYIYDDGSRYIGQWQDGQREGAGVLLDANGGLIWAGEWKDDERVSN